MSMIRWKTVGRWSWMKALRVLAVTALLFVSATGEPAVGSARRSGTSNGPVPPIQNSMTLRCQITSLVMSKGDPKNITTELPHPSGSLMFTVVDGQLAMVGPEGAQRFHLLSNNAESGSMYFEELTGAGNVVLWVFHSLKNGRILFSGNLSVNNSGPTVEQILLMTQAGYCEATGGYGQPVRK
jgi:hypothetical protein